jgi:hypothetical protein
MSKKKNKDEDPFEDPDIKAFLEHADKPGPWSEEDDKIYTVGGLSADKDGDFMKFQNKINKMEEKNMPEGRMIELVKAHFNLSISHDYNDFESSDCTIYNESTADGYDVYIITNDTKNVSVCEDVYYYDHDLAEQFKEQIRYGDTSFFIDEDLYGDAYFEDCLIELFIENVENIIKNKELSFFAGEVEFLKEEYDK